MQGPTRRPFISVHTLLGATTTWLYDTGAEVSVMAQIFFRKIPIEKRPKKKPVTMKLSSASKDALKATGVYEMPVTVMGKTVRHDIIVVQNINSNATMGSDLIEQLGVVYYAKKKKFAFETDEPLFFEAHMETLSAEIIPAFTQMPIRMATSTKGGNRPATNLNCIATILSLEFPQLGGGPGWVVPNHAGQVTMVVQNCSPVDMHIPRGTKMGVLENIHGEKIQPMDGKKIIEQLEKEDVNPETIKPLSAAEQKEFLDKLNLNVLEDARKLYKQLIQQNHDVFSRTKDDLCKANNFKHKVFTKTDEPIFQKQYPIPDMHREYLEKQVQEWLKMGIVQPSTSRYNSPMFLAPKKDGGVRVVQDFGALNVNSHDDRYSMKNINECIGDIGRACSTIFSTLDLTSGFWQMHLDEKSKHLTAFTVPGMGQFEWTMSPMRLLGCPAIFQRLVEAAMNGLENVLAYIDDLLFHIASHQLHREILQQLFHRLRKTGLKVNLAKCKLLHT